MPASNADIRKLSAHLERVASKVPIECPVCGHAGWEVEGPVVGLRLVPGPSGKGWQISTEGGPPVMITICSKCFFTRQFAWLPISEAGPSGG
jgi:hypothetical protein